MITITRRDALCVALAAISPMPYGTNDIRVTRIGDRIYALGGENIPKPTRNTTKWLRIGEIRH